jgi:hypothetical protein
MRTCDDSKRPTRQTSRAVAASGNGHTNIGDVPFPGLPFEAWWFKGGLYIVQAPPVGVVA